MKSEHEDPPAFGPSTRISVSIEPEALQLLDALRIGQRRLPHWLVILGYFLRLRFNQASVCEVRRR